ncbi:hypothetical protein ABT117_04715 [Streptomyces sp. NPDC002262]|uniref:hypothetical protein n=1 Tax=Streptomyces sp. NPDC002262 TaxID=3154414 RepID=UPI0033267807
MKHPVSVQGAHADHEAMAGRGSAQGPAWDEGSLTAMVDFMNTLNEEPATSGEMLDGRAWPTRW